MIAKGRLTPRTARRVVDHIAWAEEAGADVILVTCSSIGAAVGLAAAIFSPWMNVSGSVLANHWRRRPASR